MQWFYKKDNIQLSRHYFKKLTINRFLFNEKNVHWQRKDNNKWNSGKYKDRPTYK